MRILYLIDEIWKGRGGSEQHLFWLLRCLPSGFERHFIVFSYVHEADPATFPQRPIILTEQCGGGKGSWFKRLRFLARYIKEQRIDIVQTFSPLGELAGVLAVRLARRGTVLGNRRDCGYHINWKTRCIYRISRFFRTHYVANSEAAKQAAIRNEGTPPERFTVIRNPVSHMRFEEASQNPASREAILEKLGKPGSPDGDKGQPLVGMIATVRTIKDHETFLRAIPIILRSHPETLFPMIGECDPVHLEHLKRLDEELHISENVIWFGGIDNPIRLLPLLEIGVLSTHSESFSNAVLEYAASGLPAVVSNVGGLGEIVRDGETGYLVPPQDPEALAAAVIRLLDDPELRKKMGKCARYFVQENYAEKIVLEHYAALYQKVAGGMGAMDKAGG